MKNFAKSIADKNKEVNIILGGYGQDPQASTTVEPQVKSFASNFYSRAPGKYDLTPLYTNARFQMAHPNGGNYGDDQVSGSQRNLLTEKDKVRILN